MLVILFNFFFAVQYPANLRLYRMQLYRCLRLAKQQNSGSGDFSIHYQSALCKKSHSIPPIYLFGNTGIFYFVIEFGFGNGHLI